MHDFGLLRIKWKSTKIRGKDEFANPKWTRYNILKATFDLASIALLNSLPRLPSPVEAFQRSTSRLRPDNSVSSWRL